MAETGAFTIDADWLEQKLGTPGLSIVDASWYLPAQRRDAKAEYEAAYVPEAARKILKRWDARSTHHEQRQVLQY